MKDDSIALPPLPAGFHPTPDHGRCFDADDIRAYARAAIEADRKRRDVSSTHALGEPECNHCGGTGDVSGEYPGIACPACVGTGKAPQPAEPDVLPGEAIFGFSAWLTSLKTPVTFSECHGAAIGADLAAAYNTSQGFIQVREDFHKRLKPYPKYEPSQPAEPVGEWVKAEYGNYPALVWSQDYVAQIGAKLYAAPQSSDPSGASTLHNADSGAQNGIQAPQPAEPVKGDPNTGCPIPPLGWHCTRVYGHDGPCAAVEAPEEIELVKRGMDRLRSASAEPVKVPSDGDLLELIREHAFRQYEFDDLLAFARTLLARYGKQPATEPPSSD